MQKEIEINKVKIPVIIEGKEGWYPISYIGSKVLLKELAGNQLIRNGYGEYIKQFNIDYGENTGGIQNTYCISEDGLKKILMNCKLGRLNVEQKIAMKEVCKFIKLDIIIDTEEKFLDSYPENKWREYDFWSVECIESILLHNKNIKWQRCSKCGNYYPYLENFFEKECNPNNLQPLRCICKNCKRWSDSRAKIGIQHINKDLHNAYRKYGKDIYLYYKNSDIISLWKWRKNTGERIKKCAYEQNDNVLKLLKYLYDIGEISNSDLNSKTISKILGYELSLFNIKISDVYKELTGINLVKDGYGIECFEDAKSVFLNYVQNHNIKIDYNTDLWCIIKDTGLTTYLTSANNDILKFILEVYNHSYLSYKFKGGYKVFWENKENRILALKQLIEDDMRIPLEKIPLYLTLENLRKHSGTMRNVLKKYYDNNLWLWVNELYPDIFTEEDFNITVIRHVFDSAEEATIHDLLTDMFKNVLYNQRNTKNTITLLGMQPDWFIFTERRVWIVEYFGIAVDHREYNQRIKDYKEKMLSKIEKYKTLSNYGMIYIYPDDLKDNFKGLYEKLNDIE